MKVRVFAMAMALLATAWMLRAAAAGDLDAAEVMRRNYYAGKISGFTGDAVMTLVNDQNQERVRHISVWSHLKDNGVDSAVLMRFTQPEDIKSTAFLQIENSAGDDDIWVYLPALAKVRRLVSSNKKDSFFGTDFSYGDVLPPSVSKYRHTLKGDEAIDGQDCYVVESVPVDDKVRDDNGYARKVSWIDKKDFLERKVLFYGADGKLLKTETSSQHTLLDPQKQRWIPQVREMVNHETGHRTVYRFERLTLVPSLSEKLFTTRSLERE
jgi:outer membrane lipoprotein-sorting protein